VHHTIHLRVTPFLIGVTLATGGCLTVPAVAWASGGGHAGGRAAAGTARAHGAAPARIANIVRGGRPPVRSGVPRAIPIWPSGYPWYGVGYPYQVVLPPGCDPSKAKTMEIRRSARPPPRNQTALNP